MLSDPFMCLMKNLNASKPFNQSKGLDGNIGCSRDKGSTCIVVNYKCQLVVAEMLMICHVVVSLTNAALFPSSYLFNT